MIDIENNVCRWVSPVIDVLLPLFVCLPEGLSILALAYRVPNVCAGIADDPVKGV